jgi:hypothetical protein
MALYIKELDIGFVHIPKTAGTSITQWIVAVSKHLEYNLKTTKIQHDFCENVLQHVNNYFCVVRNPYSRICSYYEFAKRRRDFWEPNGFKLVGEFPSLYEFLQRTKDIFVDLGDGQKQQYKITSNQVDWIRSGNPTILKFENLKNDFKQIQEKFYCSAPLPLLNPGTERLFPDYYGYYDSKTKKLVSQLFEEDIDTFGYTF